MRGLATSSLRMSFSYPFLSATHLAKIVLDADTPLVCLPPRFPTDAAVLAFTGTRTWRDLLVDDLDVRPSKWGDHHVHGGFAQRTRTLLHNASRFLESHTRFVLAGHSLGGACAVLAADALGSARVAGVYTFGAPPVGTRTFASHYLQTFGDRTVHYVTPRDIVVRRVPRIYRITGPSPVVLDPVLLTNDDDETAAMSAWDQHDMALYHDLLRAHGH